MDDDPQFQLFLQSILPASSEPDRLDKSTRDAIVAKAREFYRAKMMANSASAQTRPSKSAFLQTLVELSDRDDFDQILETMPGYVKPRDIPDTIVYAGPDVVGDADSIQPPPPKPWSSPAASASQK